jgi:hypothetical protein
MIHQFAQDTGGLSADRFNSILKSFRSDVEQRHSPIQIHNPESADLKLARLLANEQINISGAEIKVYIRTDNADYDEVWDEDPDPTYWNPEFMKAFFKPQPIEVELAKWGADTKNKTEVVFSHFQIFDQFGERMLRAGDVVQLPYNAAAISPKNFRIINVTPSGNFRYHWLYLTCTVETLAADITVRPEEDMPSEERIKTNGRYVEGL